jgi:SAM-dependent methyltransferase
LQRPERYERITAASENPARGVLDYIPQILREEGVDVRETRVSRHVIYCVNAIHHFRDPHAFVSAVVTLLRPGGLLAVIGMDPRAMRSRWFVYDYFPGTWEADLRRFPSHGQLVDWFSEADLQQVELRIVEHVSNPRRGPEILTDPFFRRDACSQFALLSDDDFARGCARVRAAAGRDTFFPAELSIAMVSGRMPGFSRDSLK